jgi:disulfide bond formation protein DsbB
MSYLAVIQSLAGLALIALAGAVGLLGSLALPGGRRWLATELEGRARLLLSLALLAAVLATSGSLYFSEVVGFTPCLLCWWQRIAMYPLVPVLAIALFREDEGIWRYVLPLSGIGLLISMYHVLIQYRPALDVVTCEATAPCTARYVAVFGWMSIPVMAGIGFLLIGALMLVLSTLRTR